jgi:uncharacterized protein YqiB (DUF1249 family)
LIMTLTIITTHNYTVSVNITPMEFQNIMRYLLRIYPNDIQTEVLSIAQLAETGLYNEPFPPTHES